jgi:hypothetical protein
VRTARSRQHRAETLTGRHLARTGRGVARPRKIVTALVAYDALLVPAILLLECYYFVDTLGGMAIAAVVIWFVGKTREERTEASVKT